MELVDTGFKYLAKPVSQINVQELLNEPFENRGVQSYGGGDAAVKIAGILKSSFRLPDYSFLKRFND